jgi:monoamine oxidase
VSHKAFEVIVVGAGASGLAAARYLSQRSVRVTILEARQRLGGRILTVRVPCTTGPVELGAEFVHGEPAQTLEIIRDARLNLQRLPDIHHRSKKGEFSLIPGFWDKLAGLRRDISRRMSRASKDCSLAEYLERHHLPREQRFLLLNFAEGYNAADANKISAQSLAFEDEENHKQFRPTDGYGRLVKWLRHGLEPSRTEVRVNTVATEIRWKRGEVSVQCSNAFGTSLGPFRANAAVITLPIAILRAKRLRFLPEIADKSESLEKLETGQVFKVMLGFREAFWQSDSFLAKRGLGKDGLCNAINFVHAEEEDIPVWWNHSPSQDRVLTGWAADQKPRSSCLPTRKLDSIRPWPLWAMSSRFRGSGSTSCSRPGLCMIGRKIRLAGWPTHTWESAV